MSKEITKMLQKNSCVAPCAPSPVAVAPAVVFGWKEVDSTNQTHHIRQTKNQTKTAAIKQFVARS